MKSVADKLKKIGAHTYLIFAKTAELVHSKGNRAVRSNKKGRLPGYPAHKQGDRAIQPLLQWQ